MRFALSVSAAFLFSAVAFAQVPVYPYAYGPFVPRVTTPQISLQTVSPTPVGATNATYGLTAGARNSTFETMGGDASTTYTEGVWYTGGGAPHISREVSLYPRPARGMREERMATGERHEAREEAPRQWTYFGASEMETPIDTSAGKSAAPAKRVITNDDINRFNQNTGTVKYDSKTEKIQ